MEETKGTKIEPIPIYKKLTLTIDEAAEYSNIGRNKLRELVKMPHCPFLLYSGRNVLIKRIAFEHWLENQTSI